jgi:hypothetical protein
MPGQCTMLRVTNRTRHCQLQLLILKKIILNLLRHVLIDSEVAVLMKGLNYTIGNPHSNLDMTCAVESVVPESS